jgi:hypothetical protein
VSRHRLRVPWYRRMSGLEWLADLVWLLVDLA